MQRPLEGIRVLDLTIWQQGPYATAMLADLGADVIKIEERASGDPGRFAWLDPSLGLSSYFEAHNRGKRSVALDLKQIRGREVFLRLAAAADVYVSNYRIGAIERLGLGYDTLLALNPGIVYVQASGFGPAGPDADAGAFDFLAQARGGFASTNGEPDDPPLPTQVPIADQVGAFHVAIAVLSGLVSRNLTGSGIKLDTSLLGSQISLQAFDMTTHLFTGRLRTRAYRGGSRPFWREYLAGDGQWFVIGMLLDRAWPDLAHAIGRPELASDDRFETYIGRVGTNAEALITLLDEVFLTAAAPYWVERLNAIGMFAALIQDYAQVAIDPQVVANGYVHEVEHPGHDPVRMPGIGIAVGGQPLTVTHLAPQHGEHTEQVLLEAGYSWGEITELCAADIAGPAYSPDHAAS
jgi:crotonobetainyl-CoA:carnitine CoA-transferase CaiB-like acyl-CoA transferase